MNDPEIIYERIQNAKAKANRQDKIFFVAVSKNHTVEGFPADEENFFIAQGVQPGTRLILNADAMNATLKDKESIRIW